MGVVWYSTAIEAGPPVATAIGAPGDSAGMANALGAAPTSTPKAPTRVVSREGRAKRRGGGLATDRGRLRG